MPLNTPVTPPPDVERPLVSIVVAVRNAAHSVKGCIESCLGQTWPSKELIIVDGASADGTADIIKDYAPNLAWWVSEPDKGLYDAWNKAVRQARGTWICFIGADDYLWDERVLERMAPALKEAETRNILYVYGKTALLNPDSSDIQYVVGVPWEQAKRAFRTYLPISHCGSFHHRSLFDLYGSFDTSFKIASDYDFLLRHLPKNEAKFVEDVIVVGMRYGGVSNNLDTKRAAFKELLRARRNNGISSLPLKYAITFARILFLRLLRPVLGEISTSQMDMQLQKLTRRLRGALQLSVQPKKTRL